MWFNLPDLTRRQIKEALMAQLGCEQETQIKNAGLCLAALAFVELPKSQWPEFLHFMTQNS